MGNCLTNMQVIYINFILFSKISSFKLGDIEIQRNKEIKINPIISKKKNNSSNKDIKLNNPYYVSTGDVIINSNKEKLNNRIEVRSLKQYNNLNLDKDKNIIEYSFNSKFKSPYADYINHTTTMDTSQINNELKNIKSYKEAYPSNFDKFIYFSDIFNNKGRTESIRANKDPKYDFDLKDRYRKDEIIIEGNEESNE